MSIRVYKLSKELNIDNKKLIEILKKNNINVKNHMSIIEDEHIEVVKKFLSSDSKLQEKEEDNKSKKNKVFVVFRAKNIKNSSNVNKFSSKIKVSSILSKRTQEKEQQIFESKKTSINNENEIKVDSKTINEDSKDKKNKTQNKKNKYNQKFKNDDFYKKTEKNKFNKNVEKRKDKNYKFNYEDNDSYVKIRNNKKNKKEKVKDAIKLIEIPENVTIKELADKMKIRVSEIIKKLFMQNIIVTSNQIIDFATAEDIALKFNVLAEKQKVVNQVVELQKEEEEKEENLSKRPPIICVMGHVDHGKTSLIEKLKKINIIGKESGGITQHIGAYTVNYNNEKITVLDTPGHEAFSKMRMRGANLTDIVILIVAVDDGVMPQTIEAIKYLKQAQTEVIVAINKIDKVDKNSLKSNIERIKQDLAKYDILSEDYGGTVSFCPISAKTGEGINDLLEIILLNAEILELKANKNRLARGIVIESKMDKFKGVVTTLLVQKGTLNKDDIVACCSSYGRVRVMLDEYDRKIKKATPSTPVKILGLNNISKIGEMFLCYKKEKDAKNYINTYIDQEKKEKLKENKLKVKINIEDINLQIKNDKLKRLNVIVKADVKGSEEAIRQCLEELKVEDVIVDVIYSNIGNINESDINLAKVSNAIIIGFNVKTENVVNLMKSIEDVNIKIYSVIYNIIDDIRTEMKKIATIRYEQKIIGHVEVRKIFKSSKVGIIAGSYVTDGIIKQNSKIKIFRDNKIIYDGEIASLQSSKNFVKESKVGTECGIVVKNFNDIKLKDIIEAYELVEIAID